jgi:hypothetical protein
MLAGVYRQCCAMKAPGLVVSSMLFRCFLPSEEPPVGLQIPTPVAGDEDHPLETHAHELEHTENREFLMLQLTGYFH